MDGFARVNAGTLSPAQFFAHARSACKADAHIA
jgi:hypothetical protein